MVYLDPMETTNEPPASTGAPMEFTPTAPSAARAILLANSPREYTPVRHMLVQRHEKDPTTGDGLPIGPDTRVLLAHLLAQPVV